MNKDSPGSSIMLPASVLDVLKDVNGGALKVFIYLCSCNRGQPRAASIESVANATGIQPRSAISALKTLREHNLVTRISGSGNQPNQYGISLPKRQDTAAPPTIDTTIPSVGLRPITSPTAIPTQTTTLGHVTLLPSVQSGQCTAISSTPAPAAIPALIAHCYRPMTEQEYAQVKQAWPDEVVLCERLERSKLKGYYVEPTLTVSFFIEALKQFT